METAKSRAFHRADNLFIPLAVLVTYLLLVLIDKDTRSIGDVFSIRIIPGMLIYGLPGILVCSLLLRHFVRRHSIARSALLAVSIGILSTFTLIIISLQLLKNFL